MLEYAGICYMEYAWGQLQVNQVEKASIECIAGFLGFIGVLRGWIYKNIYFQRHPIICLQKFLSIECEIHFFIIIFLMLLGSPSNTTLRIYCRQVLKDTSCLISLFTAFHLSMLLCWIVLKCRFFLEVYCLSFELNLVGKNIVVGYLAEPSCQIFAAYYWWNQI